VVQNFSGNSPEKKYPKLVSKFWGLPPRKFAGVKVRPNFVILRLFRPFLPNRARYQQSDNGLLIYGHSSIDCRSLYKGAVGGGIPIRRSSVEIISSYRMSSYIGPSLLPLYL